GGIQPRHEPRDWRIRRRQEGLRRFHGALPCGHESAEPKRDDRPRRAIASYRRSPERHYVFVAARACRRCHDRRRRAAAATHEAPGLADGRRFMSATAQKAEPSVQERIQLEVNRAIQRSIKGVEYIASAAPVVGTTPKDVLHARGTMKLYHYRPLADEI